MKIRVAVVLLLNLLVISACQKNEIKPVQTNNEPQTNSQNTPPAVNNDSGRAAQTVENNQNVSQKNQPKTVREFFNLLPQKYFLLEGCEPQTDKNCDKARREYVKNYLEVEDTKNGYWKSGCDGAQSCLTMALFKRPDGSYIVAVHTLQETEETNYFLDYKDGKWTDIGANAVPEFSDKNIYELPRYGTTVEVYKKNYPEPEYSERGAKIYSLEWKDGKFTKK